MTSDEMKKVILATTNELEKIRQKLKETTNPQEERQLLYRVQEIVRLHRLYFEMLGYDVGNLLVRDAEKLAH